MFLTIQGALQTKTPSILMIERQSM